MTNSRLRLAITVCVFLAACAVAIEAQQFRAQLKIGMPVMWTLDQAHYLLARQRTSNLSLKAADLTPNDLNPNAINSARLNALRVLFSAEVGFDQERGAGNADALTRRSDLRGQQSDLAGRLDALRDQQATLVKEIGALQIDGARLDPELQKIDKAVNAAQVTAKQSELALIDKRIADTTSLATSVEAGLDKAMSLKSFAPTSTATLPESSVSPVIAKALDSGPARLQASVALDNYIQMQYELIAKQLSLLRDDVGKDNKLVFLELPVSVYTSPNAKDILVQTHWAVESLIRCKTHVDNRPVTPMYQEIYHAVCETAATAGTPNAYQALSRTTNLNVLLSKYQAEKASLPLAWMGEGAALAAEFRPVVPATIKNSRVVDLFPRQAALNVNAVQDTVRRVNLSAFFSLISGLGAKTQFDRQREMFEDYIQQDVFASGFGKGESRFGWTFGPLPGSRVVASGVKTTYAAVVVPSDVQAISLRGAACQFNRQAMPEDPLNMNADQLRAKGCLKSEPFVLTVPTDREGYELTSVRYTQVEPTETATIEIRGNYLSPQVGVLVDGSPAKLRALGLAQTGLDPTVSLQPDDHFMGEFEYVNSGLIVLRLKGRPDVPGTPRITLITPTHSGEINGEALTINSSTIPTTLNAESVAGRGLFKGTPLSISTARLIAADAKAGRVSLDLAGTGFGPSTAVDVNGQVASRTRSSPRLIRVTIEPHADPKWNVTVAETTDKFAVVTIDNPLLLKKTSGEVVLSIPATGAEKERLNLKLGVQTPDDDLDTLTVTGGTLVADTVAISATDINIEVTAPADTVTVSLRRTIGPFQQVLVWTFARQKDTPGKWVVK